MDDTFLANRASLVRQAFADTFAPQPYEVRVSYTQVDRDHNVLTSSSLSDVASRRLDEVSEHETLACWQLNTFDGGTVLPVDRVYLVDTQVVLKSELTNEKAADVRAYLTGLVSVDAAPLLDRVEIENANRAVYRMCLAPHAHPVERTVLPQLRSEEVDWMVLVGILGGGVAAAFVFAMFCATAASTATSAAATSSKTQYSSSAALGKQKLRYAQTIRKSQARAASRGTSDKELTFSLLQSMKE